jgi:hypothetical protein
MFERMIGEEIAKKGGFGLAAYVEDAMKKPPRADQAEAPAAELGGATRS